jgi:hypothetical protein
MQDIFGNNWRLSSERWRHIIERHPEIKQKKEIQQTLLKPDAIIKSYKDPLIHIYQRKLNDYYLTVVVQVKEQFIITAFIADKIKRGRIIWRKNSKSN